LLASNLPLTPSNSQPTLLATYILPIKTDRLDGLGELSSYLGWLTSTVAEVIVVDGSASPIFEAHARAWRDLGLRQLHPDPRHASTNGKVAGVLTGLYAASCQHLVIGDDDVRYGYEELSAVLGRLAEADVVRPQNYFSPLSWHTRLDTARSLLNRAFDGDWPGTLAVNRSVLLSTGGYDGDVMFENLELVRTVIAAGGREELARDVLVRRLPPRTSQFAGQRVRQAYDEFARPMRLLLQLCLLPAILLLSRRPRLLMLAAVASVACAEFGRRRDGGARVFAWTSSLLAPVWLTERAVCCWLAVLARWRRGGIRYHGHILHRAATPQALLNQRYRAR
jgi:hypothetical protein